MLVSLARQWLGGCHLRDHVREHSVVLLYCGYLFLAEKRRQLAHAQKQEHPHLDIGLRPDPLHDEATIEDGQRRADIVARNICEEALFGQGGHVLHALQQILLERLLGLPPQKNGDAICVEDELFAEVPKHPGRDEPNLISRLGNDRQRLLHRSCGLARRAKGCIKHSLEDPP